MWVCGVGSGTLSGILDIISYLVGENRVDFSLFFKGYGNLYGKPEMGGNKCLLRAVGVAPLSVLELGGWLEKLSLMLLIVPLVWSPRFDSALSVMIEPTILPLGPVLSTELIPPWRRDLKFLIRDDASFSGIAQSLRLLWPRGKFWNSLSWLNSKESCDQSFTVEASGLGCSLGFSLPETNPFFLQWVFGLLANVQILETSLPLEVTSAW